MQPLLPRTFVWPFDRANKIVNYNSRLARTGVIWCNLYGRVSAEIESDDLTLVGGRGESFVCERYNGK